MKYGERLKALRKRKGLSQKELTERLHLNRSTYARYETSTTQPDYDTLKKLAEFHEVTTDYILGHEVKDIDSMTEDEIDEEIKEIMREVNVWYKDEPKDKKEKLIMLRKIIKTFIED